VTGSNLPRRGRADVSGEATGGRGESVAQVVHPYQRQPQSHHLVFQDELELGAAEVSTDLSGVHHPPAQSPGDIPIARFVEQTSAPLIVQGQHPAAVLRQILVEQAPFRAEIAVHVTVEVEMVSGQVGPHRDLEPQARQSIHHQRMRGHLHGDHLPAIGDRPAEQRCEVGGLGRRTIGRQPIAAGQEVAESSKERGSPTICLEDQTQQVSRRALAVGAGDADNLQLTLGIASEYPRGLGHCPPRLERFDPG
jgi:hypothetical protein